MKKLFAAGIVLILALSFSGCGPAQQNGDVNNGNNQNNGADDNGGTKTEQFTLTGNKWVLVTAKNEDGTTFTPAKQGVFSLTFSEDGNLFIGTDCNMMSAPYTIKDGKIELGEILSTMMYCEGSEEGKFSALVAKISGYKFSEKGDLILSSDKEPELMVLIKDDSFWKSVPQGDFAADMRDPQEVCSNLQKELKYDNCKLVNFKTSMDKTECADGMSVAGCFACKFSCAGK